jgi:hypothetical protein
MTDLPKRYMMKSHHQRAEMHEEILMVLENISSNSLPNIYLQLQNVEAKRSLIRELLTAKTAGIDLRTELSAINSTMERDSKYDF